MPQKPTAPMKKVTSTPVAMIHAGSARPNFSRAEGSAAAARAGQASVSSSTRNIDATSRSPGRPTTKKAARQPNTGAMKAPAK